MLQTAAVVCRTAWHDAAVGGPELREAYCSAPDKRKHHYHVLNALIAQCKGQGPHVIGSSSTFVDAVTFALLWGECHEGALCSESINGQQLHAINSRHLELDCY
jgi:hypothetical protein